jgi:hypothetical protein
MVIGKNKIKIVICDVNDVNGDVVLNWTTDSFQQGPPSFYKLLKLSGYQPFDAINTFKLNIVQGDFREGDALSTIAGLLKFNLIIHAIIPVVRDYNLSWRNIIACLAAYRKHKNICRNLYITIPEWGNLIDNITCFLNYQSLLKDMEYVFMVNDKEQKLMLESMFISLAGKDIEKENKFLNKIDKFLSKISSRLPSNVFSIVYGNNKKKLQKTP